MRTKGAAWHQFVIWAALLGINHRTLQYFCENRPDMTAMCFTTMALALLGLGLERRRRVAVAMGTVCLVVGFFFKQTAGAFAAVPAIVLALRGRRPTRSEVLLALAPVAAMISVVQALRAFPAVYHYMIDVPRSYRVNWPLAAKFVWQLLLDSPLFVVLVGEWLVTDGGSMRKRPRVAWLVAVLAVGIPSGAAAEAKFGGAPNSMLPALLGMMAFCALRLPGTLSRLEQGAGLAPRPRALGSFAASLLLLTVFPHNTILLHAPPWNDGYGEAISTAARLPGVVVCPEDPTIPLYAREYAGGGLFAELDARPEGGAWPKQLPRGVLNELHAADFVVDIQDYWGDHLNEANLRRLGFVPADGARPVALTYRIWRREASAADSRTAWNTAGASSRRRVPGSLERHAWVRSLAPGAGRTFSKKSVELPNEYTAEADGRLTAGASMGDSR